MKLAIPLLLLLLLAPPSNGVAATPADDEFQQANKLYETAKYAEAAATYQKLVQSGKASPGLFFNLGNALFKSGQTGRALVWFRRAEVLAPRDPDIQANLQFVRKSVSDAAASSYQGLSRILNKLTLNEWAALTMAILWLWFFLLILREWKSELKRPLRGYVSTAGAVAAILALCLGLVAREHYTNRDAIIIVPEAVVRTIPIEKAPSSYALHDGAEITILAEREDWLQLIDSSNRKGWVRRDQVAFVFSPTGG